MILIDTNVISELMRPVPDPAVLSWFDAQDALALFLNTVTEAELRRGVASLPEGKRRDQLQAAMDAMIDEDFAGRVLPFDSAAATAFAAIFTERQTAGRPISFPDCQIAAIARARGAAVATRNIKDFEDCGITIINPWDHANNNTNPN